MRDIWKVLGGVVVGILAVTGVMAMDDEQESSFVEHNEEELEEEAPEAVDYYANQGEDVEPGSHEEWETGEGNGTLIVR